MPVSNNKDEKELKLIHYNLAYKPWHFEDILYKEYFWEYAQKTEYIDDIIKIRDSFTEEDRFNSRESDRKLRKLAQKECDCVGDDRKNRR
jgi:lipopolysaccharide biosynthesis glycosyltransferase